MMCLKNRKFFVGLICTSLIIALLILFIKNIDVKSDDKFYSLTLNQGEAYISISKNDIEGYNRWLPFYFSLSSKRNLTVEEVEKELSEEIDKAVLYTTNGELYSTDQLIWSAYEVAEKTYNLTLVLVPELDSLNSNGAINVESIVLVSSDWEKSYNLPEYIVDERNTISSDELYVSLSSMESDIIENGTAYVNYGIFKNNNEISEFFLEYSKSFSPVIDYSIVNENQGEDDSIEYSVLVQLKENSEKTVFRPFLKVNYRKQKCGFLVPSVPVYFR